MPDARSGLGPYRTPSPPFRRRFRALPQGPLAWIAPGLFLAAALVVVATRACAHHPVAVLPSSLVLKPIGAFPSADADLPPSTPLAPLLAADQPEALAVMAPDEGATRVRRGAMLQVRFNRPMVSGAELGRDGAPCPLVFTPPIPGTARWLTRSTVGFTPDTSAFDRGLEATLAFAEGVASVDGETLADDTPRSIVLDGHPHLARHETRVDEGQPLRVYFDARVTSGDVTSQLFAYEVGGGYRALPVLVATRGYSRAGEFLVELHPRRTLPAGSRIGVAVGPTWSQWGGSQPETMQFELAPRPRIEGVACSGSDCAFAAAPGVVVDFGADLTVRSTHPLGPVDVSTIAVRPPVRSLRVEVPTGAGIDGRNLIVHGEWEPDQVYEVRIGDLRTTDGRTLVRTAPLAVRSSGHDPEIRVATGRLYFESDAALTLPFRAIHADTAMIHTRDVAPGDEASALLDASTYASKDATGAPLAPLVPDARPNRWGRGTLSLDGPDTRARMSVVALAPAAQTGVATWPSALVVRTDLGVTTQATPDAMLVWVTSLAHGGPVPGVEIALRTEQSVVLAKGRTDDDGLARFPLRPHANETPDYAPLEASTVLVLRKGDDRVAMLFDPRRAIGASQLGLTPGTSEDTPRAGVLRATVIADRGAYRPGEKLHALAIVRRVHGADVQPATGERVALQLQHAGSGRLLGSSESVVGAAGAVEATFDLPRDAPLGTYLVQAVSGTPIGFTDARLAEFREPHLRADVDTGDVPLVLGDAMHATVSAKYLFGSPVAGAHVSYTLTRTGHAALPARWSEWETHAVGTMQRVGTVAQGEATLDAAGLAHVDVTAEPSAPARTGFELEVEVRDGSGETTAARHEVVVFPAEWEVALRRGHDVSHLGDALRVEAAAIAHDGTPSPHRAVEARFVREGWYGWYEWEAQDQAAADDDDGAYRLRRSRERRVMHACRLTTDEGGLASCAWTPTRAGTYVLEVESRDAHGKTTLASRRIYVAGPDETPDRDPPGAPIALTPTRATWSSGDDAELAFESPWDDAEALVTVAQSGVRWTHREHVGAGGHVVRVPLTDAMVPNTFVTLTLVRPRTAAPETRVDLGAPDLRVGGAELVVHPRTSELEVHVEHGTGTALPGAAVPVTVRVTDDRGRASHAHVAIWAVDEGTLRLTSYALGDPAGGFFVRRGAAVAVEDLRRSLVSRVAGALEPEPSGDGGETSERDVLDERERYESTPLWMPLLEADSNGRVTTTLTLPDRTTEYRIMAVAIDDHARSGKASGALLATRPLVVRATLPRSVTDGDTFEATLVASDTTDADLDADVSLEVRGGARMLQHVHVAAHGETRIDVPIEVHGDATLEVVARGTANGVTHEVTTHVEVRPRVRWVRRRAVTGGVPRVAVPLTVPEPAGTRGSARVSVASHPFVALGGTAEALAETWWSSTDVDASVLLGLVAWDRLADGLRDGGVDREALRAREARALARLLAAQTVNGGFRSVAAGDDTLEATATAGRALVAARDAARAVPAPALAALREALVRLMAGHAMRWPQGIAPTDSDALALRVLASLGAPDAAAMETFYQARETATPFALAHLALAMRSGDVRRSTLEALVVERLFPVKFSGVVARDGRRYVVTDMRGLAPVVELLAQDDTSHARLYPAVAELLRATHDGFGSPRDAGATLAAMASAAEGLGALDGRRVHATLDGHVLPAGGRGHAGAFFPVAFAAVGAGTHRIVARTDARAPVYVGADARWAVPIGDADDVARGRGITLHRVLETAAGTPLADGASVRLGDIVRIRLFVHTERDVPPIAVHDPLGGGLDAVDAGLDTTPRDSLLALLGASPDDDAIDARAFHAMRTVDYVRTRSFERTATDFYFSALSPGLWEVTYAVRATTPGRFLLAPAELASLDDTDLVARSTATTLVVTR